MTATDAANGNLLYHYTNIEALYNGIIEKEPESEKKAISLIATDSEYLNDINEINYGAQQIEQMLSEDNTPEFSIPKTKKRYSDISHHFIISFSQARDCLPMWSMYGKDGAGIALGFDIQELLKNLALIYPCFYHKQDVKKFVQDIRDIMEDDSHFGGKTFKFDTPYKIAFRE